MTFGQYASDTVTHIISIVFMALTCIAVNLIEFNFIKDMTATEVYAIVTQNIVFAVGMSYYAIKFAATPSSVSLESTPSTKEN